MNRINATHAIKVAAALKRYEFDKSYISQRVMVDFEASLHTRADNKFHISRLMSTLTNHTIHYFINTLKVPDPNQWQKYEDKFGTYLISKKYSVSHTKRIIQITNRFLKFLHRTRPEEHKLICLEPLAKTKFRGMEAVKNLRGKFISVADMKTIREKITNKRLLPAIELAYSFGLRRSEVLALSHEHLYESSMEVNRQLLKIGPPAIFGTLKSKYNRETPYWFIKPDQAYREIARLPMVHPDTLSVQFAKEMKLLKMPYQFHDLRRTFITNALRAHHYRDVQLAVGHSDLKTTMLYAQDDRKLSRKKFVPGALP